MQKLVRLNTKQQKWLKRNKHKLDPGGVASYLNISLEGANKLLGIKPITPLSGLSRKYERFGLVVLFTVSFFIFASGLPNAFVADDLPIILNNPLIGSWSFVIDGGLGGSIQRFIYFILANWVGVTPWPFRLVNILFHLVTSIFLFKIALKFHGFLVAFIACALFIVSPMVVEPVAWISGMPYTLGGMIAMWCVYLHLSDEKTLGRQILEICLWALAMISIEKFIFLPLLLWFWDWRRGRLKITKYVLVALLTISLIKGFSLLSLFRVRVESLTSDYYTANTGSINNPLIKPVVATGNYIWLYLWPRALTLYHSEVDLGWQSVLRYGGVVILFGFWVWLLGKRVQMVWFWVSFFIVSLVPILLPFGVSSLVAERYTYLGCAALSVIVSLTITSLWNFDWKKNLIYVLVGLVYLTLSLRTLYRIHDWRSADSLWFSAESYSPNSSQNHNNLGDAYANKGDFVRAIEEFDKAISLNPNYADAIHNRANIYLKLGENEIAKEGFIEAVRINQKLWQSYLNLAVIEASGKHWSEAIIWTQKALALNDSIEIRRFLEGLENEVYKK